MYLRRFFSKSSKIIPNKTESKKSSHFWLLLVCGQRNPPTMPLGYLKEQKVKKAGINKAPWLPKKTKIAKKGHQ